LALAVESTGLTKRFRRHVAVNAIDLAVPRGAIYGFLGPNGSGKTTTIRLLLGLIRPTAGTHKLLGEPMPQGTARVLPRVGSLVEGPAFHPYLSGRANLLRLDAADRTVDPRTAGRRVDEALDRVGLLAAAGKRFRVYSLGMRQRLALAAAMLAPRELLILDEPTNGLDPGGMRDMRDLIGRLAGEGITVFLSSHLLAEVEELCSRVAIISRGAIVYEGALAELRRRAAPRYRLRTTDVEAARAICTRQPGVTDLRAEGAELSFGAAEETVVELSRSLVHAGLGIAALVPERETLETLFFELTEQAGVQHEVAA
jgi:ABC-2 type transport system ATP-binding protein